MPHDPVPLVDPQRENTPAVRRVLIVTLVLNLVVAVAKIAYGWATGALAIRADGMHSVTDSFNNVVALVALWLASRPPDPEHPYGHRKFEFLAAGGIGVTLLVVAFDVLSDAVSRITGSHRLPELDERAYWVLGGTLVVNAFVATYEYRRGHALDSPLLKSDALHTRSDVFVTLGVLVSVWFTRRGLAAADLTAAIVVAGFIAWAGVSVLRENIRYLADAAPVDAARVVRIATAIDGVEKAHNVRSRGGPGHVFIDLHIHVAPGLTVERAHDISHEVIDAIKAELEGVTDVTVHTEPEGHHG